MKTRLQKWGNSLGLRIPKPFAEEAELTKQAFVDLSLIDGKIVVQLIRKKRHSLNQMLKHVTPENIHDELFKGVRKGKEIW